MTQASRKKPAQPVWPAVVAVLAVGGLNLSLPEPLTFGPSWLLLAVVTVILIPVLVARMRGNAVRGLATLSGFAKRHFFRVITTAARADGCSTTNDQTHQVHRTKT